MEGLPLSFDPKIFLFSIVNFVILFFILKKFLFIPVYNILAERKDKIKKSLDEMERIKNERELLTAEKNDVIAKAGKESQEILKEAEKMKKEILNNAREEVEKIIKESRASIEKEREDLKKEMDVLLIDLVTTAVDKAFLSAGKESKTNLVEAAILQSMEESDLKINK